MANVIEKAVEAFNDLNNPNGIMRANDAANAISNNLHVGEAELRALDIAGKRDNTSVYNEISNALFVRLIRENDEIVTDLKNPEGKINAKAAEGLMKENAEDRKKILTNLGAREKENPERKAELKALISKRYVRQSLEVWDDLKNPEGSLDANVARLLIQGNLRDGGVNLSALDASGKKSAEVMTTEFNDAMSKRYVKQGLGAWKDLQDPEGKMTAKEAERVINDNLVNGKASLAALDPSKSEEQMTVEFSKALAARTARNKKSGELNLDAIIGWVEDLGVKHDPAPDNGIGRKFTPAIQSEVGSVPRK